MNEFELIRRYFAPLSVNGDGVVLGIGDDAALLAPPPDQDLAITTDTLIAGRHFPSGTAAADIGWKSLAVNLSDLAAMGAQPRWYTLALSLPAVDESWLTGFAQGLSELSSQTSVSLVGGDTTRGPLSINITALGVVPRGQALRRSGARVGDRVFVSGSLGDAALALSRWQAGETSDDEQAAWLRRRLDRPTPRVSLGLALRDIASAAIDLSDGLAADLSHVLVASGVGAKLHAEHLPGSKAFRALSAPADRLHLQVSGGDDYELCVCVPAKHREAAQARAMALGVDLTDIGEITAAPGLEWRDAQNRPLLFTQTGYRHFP